MSGGQAALMMPGGVCCGCAADTCACGNIDPSKYVGLRVTVPNFSPSLTYPRGDGGALLMADMYKWNDRFATDVWDPNTGDWTGYVAATFWSERISIGGNTDPGTGNPCEYKLDMTIDAVIDRGSYQFWYDEYTATANLVGTANCPHWQNPSSIWITGFDFTETHPTYGNVYNHYCTRLVGNRSTFVAESTQENRPTAFVQIQRNITTSWIPAGAAPVLMFANLRYSAGCYAEVTACTCNSARVQP